MAEDPPTLAPPADDGWPDGHGPAVSRWDPLEYGVSPQRGDDRLEYAADEESQQPAARAG